MPDWLALSSHRQTAFVRLRTDLMKVVTMGALLKFMGLVTDLLFMLVNFTRGPNAFLSVKSIFRSTTPREYRAMHFSSLLGVSGGGIFCVAWNRPDSWWNSLTRRLSLFSDREKRSFSLTFYGRIREGEGVCEVEDWVDELGGWIVLEIVKSALFSWGRSDWDSSFF